MSRIVINDLNNYNNYLSIINEEDLNHVLGGFLIFGIAIFQIKENTIIINLGFNSFNRAIMTTVSYYP